MSKHKSLQFDLPCLLRYKGGKVRSTAARAWISRKIKSQVFKSNVYLGDGFVHVLSTGTRHRAAALEFSVAHLVARIKGTVNPLLMPSTQLDLPMGCAPVLAQPRETSTTTENDC